MSAAEQVSALSEGVLASLAESSTATLHTQLFKLGLRGTCIAGVRAIGATTRRFVGEAFTLRYIPAREDLDVVEVFEDPTHPQRAAIEQVGQGQVLVMDGRGDPSAATAGEILVTRLQVRGAAALVTDAAVRDSGRIAQLTLPVYAAGTSPAMNLVAHHAVDMQIPIACGGVAVYPGDVLVGDEDGVVVIPRHLASLVARPAVEQEELEDFLAARVAGGDPLQGTYPPSATLRAEWEASRRSQR